MYLAGGLIEAAAVINVPSAVSEANMMQRLTGVCLGIAGLGYLAGNAIHKITKTTSR